MEKEKWVLRYRATRFSFILNYFLACVFLIILFSLLPFMDLRTLSSKIILFILLGGVIFFIVEPEVKILSNEYVLTSDNIICYMGKESVEIPYKEIKNLELEQGIFGKFIDYGNVLIESSREKIKMVGINNPEEAYKIIQYKIEQVKAAEEKKESKGVSECNT